MGGCDQRVEHRILKNGPPVAIARGALDEPRIGTVDPRRRDLGRRLFEIGTDPEAIMHPLGKRRQPEKSAARTAGAASPARVIAGPFRAMPGWLT